MVCGLSSVGLIENFNSIENFFALLVGTTVRDVLDDGRTQDVAFNIIRLFMHLLVPR